MPSSVADSAPGPDPSGTEAPSSLTTSATMPGIGVMAEPGLDAVTPGSGEIMTAPVSVCHQVSTTGVPSPPLPAPPMVLRYQT